VNFYKQPEALYSPTQGYIDVKIPNMISPKEAGSSKYGCQVGSMHAPVMLCEDSIFFKQPSMYSLETSTKAVLWYCPVTEVNNTWPDTLKKDAMMRCLEKYRWILERIERVDS
jgi:hypothetical protein